MTLEKLIFADEKDGSTGFCEVFQPPGDVLNFVKRYWRRKIADLAAH
jgi:hypothetical protein